MHTNVKLKKAAEVIVFIFSADRARTEHGLELLWPFANALIWELLTIVFLGLGLGHKEAPATTTTRAAPPRDGLVTIADIAKQAGVSPTKARSILRSHGCSMRRRLRASTWPFIDRHDTNTRTTSKLDVIQGSRMNRKFADAVKRLEPKFQALMAMCPIRSKDEIPKGAKISGVYLFSDGDRHLYVGRSTRIRERFGSHVNPSSRLHDSPFATQLARTAAGIEQSDFRKLNSTTP